MPSDRTDFAIAAVEKVPFTEEITEMVQGMVRDALLFGQNTLRARGTTPEAKLAILQKLSPAITRVLERNDQNELLVETRAMCEELFEEMRGYSLG